MLYLSCNTASVCAIFIVAGIGSNVAPKPSCPACHHMGPKQLRVGREHEVHSENS